MIFHENCLPADNSHEISCLMSYFLKSSNVCWLFWQLTLFSKHYQSVKQFGFFGPDLGPNSLQRLSVDNKSRHETLITKQYKAQFLIGHVAWWKIFNDILLSDDFFQN